MFEYNSHTMKTIINVLDNCIFIIPKDLSYQLGMEGLAYIGDRTNETLTRNMDYRNQTVYIYSDLIEHIVVGDTEAPLLEQMAVSPHSHEIMKTYKFLNLVFHPKEYICFREVIVYSIQSKGSITTTLLETVRSLYDLRGS